MDYEKAYNEILSRLENIKKIKKEQMSFDAIQDAGNDFLIDIETDKCENKRVSTLIKDLKSINYDSSEIYEVFVEFMKEALPHIDKSKAKEKTFEKSIDTIKNEIGSIMLEDKQEASMKFPNFGTVKCKLEPRVEIVDKEAALSYIARNEKLRNKYLNISKQIKKEENVEDVDGLELEYDYKVSIRSDDSKV